MTHLFLDGEPLVFIYPFLSVLFYVYYTGEAVGDCKLHEFFISFNMILCIILSVISILPKVQEHLPMSGLLQSSCITLYVLYLTWSAMSNSPDDNCKPDFSGSNSTETTKIDGGSSDPSHPVRSFDTQSIIGLIVFILCVLYSSVKTSSSSQAAKLTGSDAILLKDKGIIHILRKHLYSKKYWIHNFSLTNVFFFVKT